MVPVTTTVVYLFSCFEVLSAQLNLYHFLNKNHARLLLVYKDLAMYVGFLTLTALFLALCISLAISRYSNGQGQYQVQKSQWGCLSDH